MSANPSGTFPTRFRRNCDQALKILALTGLFTTPLLALNNLISLDVNLDETVGRISFSWQRDDANPAPMTISRRLAASEQDAQWQWMAAVPREVTNWANEPPNVGTAYEYRFYVPSSPGFPHATGAYASGGFRIPLVDQQGRVLLVVDETLAADLAPEIQRYIMDLTGDGWIVETMNFARHGNATPETLRAAIRAHHTSSPLSSIVLLGRLPVAFSGLIAPDEHDLYQQATDLFYADMDGVWEDQLSTTFQDRPNHYAGDGNFDHDYIPGPNHRVEVPIGRIDLSGMTAWPESESVLMRRYLEKNHNFRLRHHQVPREACYSPMAFDESPLEAAAVVAMLGPGNCVEAYDDETEQSRPFLWGFAGRDWNGENYPGYRFKSHFTVNFASGKQAWNWDNNQMRAMLAMPWYGLTCSWGVRPNWLFHPAGMGKTLGFCNQITANNHNIADSTASLAYEPGNDYDLPTDGMVHINLMGDPTLRIHPVAPARNLAATADDTGTTLTWQPSDDTEIIGYHVYRSANRTGPYTRLTVQPVQTLGYRDGYQASEEIHYMVRSIKLERSRTGTYFNASQGVFTSLHNQTANRPPQSVIRILATRQEQAVQFTPGISDPDGDSVSLHPAGPAKQGEVRVSSGTVTYTPSPGFVGNDQFNLLAWDGLAESVSTVHVLVTQEEPVMTDDYESWRAGFDWKGQDSTRQGDPNDNGISNLMEYHLARNPLAPDSPLFSRMEKVTNENGDFIVLEFRRRKNHPALVLQCSTNQLSDWRPLAPDPASHVLEVLAPDPVGDDSAEDMRLSIRLNPFVNSSFFRFRAF